MFPPFQTRQRSYQGESFKTILEMKNILRLKDSRDETVTSFLCLDAFYILGADLPIYNLC